LLAIVNWLDIPANYSPKISSKKTTTDATLQAQGCDESFYGYAKQMNDLLGAKFYHLDRLVHAH